MLENPRNGQVATPEGSVFESQAQYSCDDGYDLFGDDTRECEADGEWSGEEPACMRT